ncbi:unnamed protein product [Staurois parvus]|uniref:Olfactory receptor n=1 Tax=Staurois parvus TaxID=386267 RepID=A0ABN9EF87_9NEOB|nr:unnamed protein product [Staurois parvus]
MIAMNKTQLTMFELAGLTNDKNLIPFLFLFFLAVYVITIMGNVGMMVIIQVFSSLHTPMYYFLNYLSLVDLLYSSTITPKILVDLISSKKSISFIGCAFQVYFYAALAGVEVVLLSSMAYDRYAAICHPLRYALIMTKPKCTGLVLLSFAVGFFQSAAQTSCLFSLEYCGSNFIEHFYCEIPPVLKLSCSVLVVFVLYLLVVVVVVVLYLLILLFVSYTLIISAILQMKSTKGRQKAFSTCSSHLMCATIFYVTVFVTYLHPSSSHLEKQNKVASVFYAVVTPMLNPLIYSLRNQEVKRVILQLLQKHKH